MMSRVFLKRVFYPLQRMRIQGYDGIRKLSMMENADGLRTEILAKQKARLLYQSRKRGMLENGLLLSTFADKYLDSLSPELTEQYDELINSPSNDWDIYYWLTGKEAIPQEFDNEIMSMLKKHVLNEHKEQRFLQPDLKN